MDVNEHERDNIQLDTWTQIKVKEQHFLHCSTFHCSVFNNEHNSCLKMSVHLSKF